MSISNRLARKPRTDDLLDSHPGQPYAYPISQAPEKSIEVPSLTRRSVTKTTQSLLASSTEQGVLDFGSAMMTLLFITANKGCWVRLYESSAARSDDASRLETVDPTPGTGVLCEFIFAPGGETFPASPAPVLYNGDTPTSGNIYYSVLNEEGVTTPITLTFTFVPLEG